MTRSLALALLFLQSPAPTTPPFDPYATLQHGFDLLSTGPDDRTRYTFLERRHIVNIDSRNRTTFDEARTYDVTYINNHPYFRLTQINDQPLSRRDEKKEQQLYDDALAKHEDFGLAKRDELAGITHTALGIHLQDALSSDYEVVEKRPETVDGVRQHVLDARLLPNTPVSGTCPWHFKFWISDKDHFITRYIVDALNDDSPLCRDYRKEASFILVDGVPKLSSNFTHSHPRDKPDYTYENEITYTNYRRFATSVTIHQGSETPTEPESSPPPNTPQR